MGHLLANRLDRFIFHSKSLIIQARYILSTNYNYYYYCVRVYIFIITILYASDFVALVRATIVLNSYKNSKFKIPQHLLVAAD